MHESAFESFLILLHAPQAWFLGLPHALCLSIAGLLLATMLALAGFVLARLGYRPLWALVLLIPTLGIVGVWWLSIRRFPRETIPATTRETQP